jgi:hypothetical protein
MVRSRLATRCFIRSSSMLVLCMVRSVYLVHSMEVVTISVRGMGFFLAVRHPAMSSVEKPPRWNVDSLTDRMDSQ